MKAKRCRPVIYLTQGDRVTTTTPPTPCFGFWRVLGQGLQPACLCYWTAKLLLYPYTSIGPVNSPGESRSGWVIPKSGSSAVHWCKFRATIPQLPLQPFTRRTDIHCLDASRCCPSRIWQRLTRQRNEIQCVQCLLRTGV